MKSEEEIKRKLTELENALSILEKGRTSKVIPPVEVIIESQIQILKWVLEDEKK